ncbi:helix-turn-helix domain-containing protein [Streptomyces sp. NPDC047928]|uniref:helix-turn-helix domain-containing protein n=1 Tax=unclassified Streptomyces TaxID=2593676 RepID=UPI003719595E
MAGRRKDIDGSLSVPCFYGKELRFQREKAGLTLEQAVRGSFYAATYLSEIERGQRRMPEDLARHMDQVLKTDGYFGRCCDDVRKARKAGHAGYFMAVVELEGRARDIDQWEPYYIPGPLQLEPYIRATIKADHPRITDELLTARVAARRERAWLHEDPKAPESWAVLHEAVLRRPVLEDNEMAEQLAHIAEVARLGRLVPQVLPWNTPTHPFAMGSTRFMSFKDAPPVMYTEGMYSGQLIDDPDAVRQYQKAYERLRATALSPEESLKMIESAAEAYRNGKRTI